MRPMVEECVTRFVPLSDDSHGGGSHLDVVEDENWWKRRSVGDMARGGTAPPDGLHLSGYAIVFNRWSQDLGGFIERIAPSAVERTLRDGVNVDALVDHRRETTMILGNTKSGTLKLKKDSYGLRVDIFPPDTTLARDTYANVKAGLPQGMSFAFRVMPSGDTWDEDQTTGLFQRTVTDMKVSEVSIVVNPAYLDTEINARNHDIDRRLLEVFLKDRWKPSMKLRERMIRVGMR